MSGTKYCIYEIRNTEDGSFYLGYTPDKEPPMDRHLSQLWEGIHTCRNLQIAFNDYVLGPDPPFEAIKVHEVRNRCDLVLYQAEIIYRNLHGGLLYNNVSQIVRILNAASIIYLEDSVEARTKFVEDTGSLYRYARFISSVPLFNHTFEFPSDNI